MHPRILSYLLFFSLVLIHESLALALPSSQTISSALIRAHRCDSTDHDNHVAGRLQKRSAVNIRIIDENAEDDKECPICLDALDNDLKPRTTACGHTFHHNCLHSWLIQHNTCPICRGLIRDPDSFDTLIQQIVEDWDDTRTYTAQVVLGDEWIFEPETIDALVPLGNQSSNDYRVFRNASSRVWDIIDDLEIFFDSHIRELRQQQVDCRVHQCSTFRNWIETTLARFRYQNQLARIKLEWESSVEKAIDAQCIFATGRKMTRHQKRLKTKIIKPNNVDRNIYAWYLNEIQKIVDDDKYDEIDWSDVFSDTMNELG